MNEIYKKGYGIIPKSIMHDCNLSLESKAIYAYFCSLAGNGNTTYPYRDTILKHLGITKNTYYRHYNPLITEGFVEVSRTDDKSAANIYQLLVSKDDGYGLLPRVVMMDKNISLKAKGLFAYLCAYCGSRGFSYPKKKDILFHLGISEPTYYKALGQLKEAGYLETHQRKSAGRFSSNVFAGFSINGNVANVKDVSVKSREEKREVKTSVTKKWDTTYGDSKNRAAYINNNYSKNKVTSNSLSATDDTKTIDFVGRITDKLFRELKNKNVGKRLNGKMEQAKLEFGNLCESGGSDAEERVKSGFRLHIERGLKGKAVRNLRAYCRASLYNWLEEQPKRDFIKSRNATGDENCASYDIAAFEQFLATDKVTYRDCVF